MAGMDPSPASIAKDLVEVQERRERGYVPSEGSLARDYPRSWRRILALLRLEESIRDTVQRPAADSPDALGSD